MLNLMRMLCSILQIGQWDCKDWIKFLEEEYFFRYQCSGCSEVNLSDLFLNAFHYDKPNCFGIIFLLNNCNFILNLCFI